MATEAPRADPLVFSMRWPVRGYELDSRGHVNNAVYLSWSEEIATAHAEAAGYGREWSERHGGSWVIAVPIAVMVGLDASLNFCALCFVLAQLDQRGILRRA